MKRILLWATYWAMSSLSYAHGTHQNSWQWNWDPVIIVSLLILLGGYVLGLQKLLKTGQTQNITNREVTAFMLALVFLILALISPLDALSDELQAWHMIQHMIIMMVAAPLFVMGAPLFVYLWALPQKLRKRFTPFYRWLYGHKSGWYFLWQPLFLWSLYAFTLWVWHLPSLYQAALYNQWLHHVQHISFFAASCLFWRVLLDPIHRLKLARGLGIMYVFATSLHATLLGVYMALSPRVWYSFYQHKTIPWNLTALEDQQLAGLIMWMPACTIYVLVTIYLFYRWLQESSAQQIIVQLDQKDL